jgi:hypothetical protein
MKLKCLMTLAMEFWWCMIGLLLSWPLKTCRTIWLQGWRRGLVAILTWLYSVNSILVIFSCFSENQMKMENKIKGIQISTWTNKKTKTNSKRIIYINIETIALLHLHWTHYSFSSLLKCVAASSAGVLSGKIVLEYVVGGGCIVGGMTGSGYRSCLKR